MRKHLNINISGFVQGVTFRQSAKTEADKLGLSGFAKNLPDGSVYIEAEGEEKKLEEFLAWCHQGPNFAKIEDVHIEQGPLKNYQGFTIK